MLASTLARATGARSGTSSTAVPSRGRLVAAAANASSAVGSMLGVSPNGCSSTHKLWQPSSSARFRNARSSPLSTWESVKTCGMLIPNSTSDSSPVLRARLVLEHRLEDLHQHWRALVPVAGCELLGAVAH